MAIQDLSITALSPLQILTRTQQYDIKPGTSELVPLLWEFVLHGGF